MSKRNIRKPGAAVLRGLRDVMNHAEADAEVIATEKGRAKTAREMFAALNWLTKHLRELEKKP